MSDDVRFHQNFEMIAVPDPDGKGWWLHDREVFAQKGWAAVSFFYQTLMDLVRDNGLSIVGYDPQENCWNLKV